MVLLSDIQIHNYNMQRQSQKDNREKDETYLTRRMFFFFEYLWGRTIIRWWDSEKVMKID